MKILTLLRSLSTQGTLLCLLSLAFATEARIVSPDYKPKEPKVVKVMPVQPVNDLVSGQGDAETGSGLVSVSSKAEVSDDPSAKAEQAAKLTVENGTPPQKALSTNKVRSIEQPNVEKGQGATADINLNTRQSPGPVLVPTKLPVVPKSPVNEDSVSAAAMEQEVLLKAKDIDKVLDEVLKDDGWDQKSIDAQIDRVLGSEEFIRLENEAAVDPSKERRKTGREKAEQQAEQPETLLNQLDGSDLMDYVAEDDLWKEQLTIENEPG